MGNRKGLAMTGFCNSTSRALQVLVLLTAWSASAGSPVDTPQMALESSVKTQVEAAIGVHGVLVDVHVQDGPPKPPPLSLDVMLPPGLTKPADLPRRAPGEASYVNPYAPPPAPAPAGPTRLDVVRDVVLATCTAWNAPEAGDDWRRARVETLNVYFEDDGQFWSTPVASCSNLASQAEDIERWKRGWRSLPGWGPLTQAVRPFPEMAGVSVGSARYGEARRFQVEARRDADRRLMYVVRVRTTQQVPASARVDQETAQIARALISDAVSKGQSVGAVQVYINDRGRHWDLDGVKWKVDFLNIPDAELLGLAQRLDAASLTSSGAPRRAPDAQADAPVGSAKAAATDLQRRRADLDRRQAAIADCKKGMVLLKGDGVTKDPVKANEYFARLANAGDSCGQFLLGLNLYVGDGITKDEVRGLALIRQAAAQGHPVAQQALAEIEGH